MRIRVVVREDGSVVFDYDGFRGKACLEEFEKLLKSLEKEGLKLETVKRTLKDVEDAVSNAVREGEV